MRPEEKLLALYARVPRIKCKRLCHGNCGPIPLTVLELKRMEAAKGAKIETVMSYEGRKVKNQLPVLAPMLGKVDCPILRWQECSLYEQRPLVCRLFGVVPEMPCPHGCEPERVLTSEEADAMLREVQEIR